MLPSCLRTLVKRQFQVSRRTRRRTGGRQARSCRPRLEFLEDRICPSTVSWNDLKGGDWDTPASWSTGSLPGSGDDVVVNLPGITITHAQAVDDSINSLTSSDPIIFSAGTLAITGSSSINSDLTLSGGTIAGPGDLAVGGLFVWSGGTMSGRGTTTVEGPLVVGGADAQNHSETLDQRTLNIVGSATYSGAGRFVTQNGGHVLKSPADFAFSAPTAPGSSVFYHDSIVNGVDPIITKTYNPDGTLASVTEDDYNAAGTLTKSITWAYTGGSPSTLGSLSTIKEHDDNGFGTSDSEWDYYPDGTLASVTQKNTSPFGSSSSSWNYNPDGSLASASETSGSSNSAAWIYYANGSPQSISQKSTDFTGLHYDDEWQYNSDRSPALITETTTNADGSLASTTTWAYSGGILNSVKQHVNKSDGTSTDYEWDNNADGTLAIYSSTNYANGTPSSINDKIYNAAGVLVNSYVWKYNTDGSLGFFSIYAENADGSATDRSWNFNGPPVSSGTTFYAENDYDAHGALTHSFSWVYQTLDTTYAVNLYEKDYYPDGTLAHQYVWSYTTDAGTVLWPTYGHPINAVGLTSVGQWDYRDDGAQWNPYTSQLNHYVWYFDVDGSPESWYNWLTNQWQLYYPAPGSIVEYLAYGGYNTAGNEILIGVWTLGTNGAPGTLASPAPAPAAPPLFGELAPTLPTPLTPGATSPPSVNRTPDLPPPIAPQPSQPPPAPNLVEVNSVSTSDSRDVTVDYDIFGPGLTQPFDIGIFRSSKDTFGSGINIEVSSIQEQLSAAVSNGSQVSGGFLTAGHHTETFALSNSPVTYGDITLAAPLAPDPELPNVIAAAYPEGNLPANVTTDDTDAHFHIYLIGAVVQGAGGDQKWVGVPGDPPAWQGIWQYGGSKGWTLPTLTRALKAVGYTDVIGVHWHSLIPSLPLPSLPLPLLESWAVPAGDNLYDQILAKARMIPNLQSNDVIDVHLIGHSRGAAVIDRTFMDLINNAAIIPPQLAHGYYKMTLLDPHPANAATVGDISINPGISLKSVGSFFLSLFVPPPLRYLADFLIPTFLYKDPPIFVPDRVNQLEDFYQKNYYNTLSSFALADNPLQSVFNLQGLSLAEMAIQDPTKTITTAQDLSPLGIGHSEVYGWYELTVLPTLGRSSVPPPLGSIGAGPPVSSTASQLAILPSPALLSDNLDPASGAPFTLYVLALNSQGNVDPTFNGSVSLGLASNPGNSVLGGTLTVTAVNGVATLSDLTISNPGSGYTFAATSNALTAATSLPINVEANQLVLTAAPPGSVAAGNAFGLAVTAEDGSGNVNTSFNGNVTVALRDYFGGTVPLNGTVTVQAVQGVATFSGLTVAPAGDYWLSAASAGLAGASTPISVIPGTASQLAISSQPASNVTAGNGFDLVVSAEDAGGNVDTTFNGNVTVALANNPGGGTLAGNLTVSAVNGVAVFLGLAIDKAGNGYTVQATSNGLSAATTAALDITPLGVATHLIATTQPPSTVTAESGFGLSISAEDDFGTLDKSFQGNVTIAADNSSSDGEILEGTLTVPASQGVAMLSGLTLGIVANNYILQVSSAGLAPAFSNSFDVTPAGVATELVVTAQPPGNIMPGDSFGLTVSAEDGLGNVDTSFNGIVTLALNNRLPTNILGGTLAVSAVNGLATFSGLTLTQPGDFKLSVTNAGLPATTTTNVVVGNLFAGYYTGTLSGNATGANGTEAINGSVAFFVDSSGAASIFVPGFGSGNVTPSGKVAITGVGTFGNLQNVAFSLTGTVVISSPGLVSGNGNWTFADGTGSGTWNATARVTSPLTPSLTWSNPADITYGTPLSNTQLNTSATITANGATTNLPGTFIYLPAIGSVLNAGTNKTLRVTFIPNDAVDYAAVTGTVSITVAQATPTLVVSDAGGPYNGQPFPATVAVIGVVPGLDNSPAASLEGVSPTLVYYAGATASGTPLSDTPLIPGTYTVAASFAGSQDYTSAGASTTFTIAPAVPTFSNAPGGTVVAGSGANLTDSATLSGGFNPTGTITFTLTAPNASIVDTETVSINGNGTYSTPNGYLPSVAGTYQWVASYSGDSNNNPVASGFGSEPETVIPGPAASFIVAGFPSPITAGTAKSFILAAVDVDGNTAMGYTGTVMFASSAAKAVLPANYTFTSSDAGVHSFSVILRSAGTQSITATDTVTNSISGTQSGITVNPAATYHLVVSRFPSKTTAGVNQSFRITAQDRYGNTTPGFTDTVSFSSTDSQSVLPANYTFISGDAGVHTFSATLKTAGTQSITVQDFTNPNVFAGARAGIVVNPAAVSILHVSGFPSSVTAGTAYNFTVTALDPYGNTTPAYRGTVTFSSTDSQALLPANYAFTSGDAGGRTFFATLNSPGAQSITATDTTNAGISGAESGITVVTLQPTAGISGPSVGVPGRPLVYTLSARESGLSASTVYSYSVQWGDGSPMQTLSGPSGTEVSHAYTTTGVYTDTLIAIDLSGNVSVPVTMSVTVSTVLMETDPYDPTRTALYVGGTLGNDTIAITPVANGGVMVGMNFVNYGSFFPTGHVVVYSQAGNDIIKTAAQMINGTLTYVNVPVLFFSGNGNDVLNVTGSSANNVLVGGGGTDRLLGGQGRDILIGGAGQATLQAGSGDDILIGGTTAYDNNAAALAAILAEWSRTDIDYSTRIAHLTGSTSGGLNGSYLLNASTVHGNGLADKLYGGPGLDWYLAGMADVLFNHTSGEVVTPV